ncbi:hypothetical protein BN873_330062 [Candidatus Competibacter denitrificans Run_A_D11]|uniref:Uncharacterized protein n=1 Tax=Candidatus Competibacter denitrificans Run_A_D11 TaxID=1400863 RepID=W6M9Y0_9GAMM|nr:hypothetical protein BN873_330062 [Candidatus Competibacter denitrificans Run_A_D11]
MLFPFQNWVNYAIIHIEIYTKNKTKPIVRSGRKVTGPISRESRAAAFDPREGRRGRPVFCLSGYRCASTPRIAGLAAARR